MAALGLSRSRFKNYQVIEQHLVIVKIISLKNKLPLSDSQAFVFILYFSNA